MSVYKKVLFKLVILGALLASLSVIASADQASCVAACNSQYSACVSRDNGAFTMFCQSQLKECLISCGL
jgi:hypothetical protein